MPEPLRARGGAVLIELLPLVSLVPAFAATGGTACRNSVANKHDRLGVRLSSVGDPPAPPPPPPACGILGIEPVLVLRGLRRRADRRPR